MARLFADDRSRLLVGAQPVKDRVPDPACPGPFAESDFGDQTRLDPVRIAGQFRIGGECRLVRSVRAKLLAQVAQRLLAEARAHVAGVTQLAIRVMHTQQQRADAGARPFRIRVATDHEFLPPSALELDPVGRPPRHISGIPAFGDNPLET